MFYEIFKVRLQSRHLCANCKFHAKFEHGNEAANCERMSVTVDMLGEIKRDQTEYFCLLFLNVLCCH